MSKKSKAARVSSKAIPKWKRFEALAGKIQQELTPDAKVTINDKIMGRRSRSKRQIDISVRRRIGQFEILIVIDCKDYDDAVDVKIVEDFIGLVDDVGANKGALVTFKGFTEGAMNRAKDSGIDLYRLIDAEDHDWKSYVALPMVCDFRGFGEGNFVAYGSRAILAEIALLDPKRVPLYDEQHNRIGTPLTLLWAMWNRREISEEPGFREVHLGPGQLFARAKDGHFERVDFVGKFAVLRRLYYGGLPLTKVSGFMDEATGNLVMPSNFELVTDALDMIEVEHSWTRIPSLESLAVKPFAVLLGFDWYPDEVPDDSQMPKPSGA